MEKEKDPLMLWRIYGYRSPENKWYIGQTGRSLLERAGKSGSQYMHDVKKFAEAIKKFGWDSMEQHVLRLCQSKEEANYYEAYYCDVYDSVNNGYNISRGRHCPGHCYSDSERDLMSKVMKGMIPKKDGTYHDDSYDCRTDPKWIKNQNCEIALSQAKAIKMLDKDSKEVIQVFKSKSEACRYLAPEKTRKQWDGMVSQIGRCLRGITDSAYGYDWELA